MFGCVPSLAIPAAPFLPLSEEEFRHKAEQTMRRCALLLTVLAAVMAAASGPIRARVPSGARPIAPQGRPPRGSTSSLNSNTKMAPALARTPSRQVLVASGPQRQLVTRRAGEPCTHCIDRQEDTGLEGARAMFVQLRQAISRWAQPETPEGEYWRHLEELRVSPGGQVTALTVSATLLLDIMLVVVGRSEDVAIFRRQLRPIGKGQSRKPLQIKVLEQFDEAMKMVDRAMEKVDETLEELQKVSSMLKLKDQKEIKLEYLQHEAQKFAKVRDLLISGFGLQNTRFSAEAEKHNEGGPKELRDFLRGIGVTPYRDSSLASPQYLTTRMAAWKPPGSGIRRSEMFKSSNCESERASRAQDVGSAGED